MAELVLGPLLRYVSEREATVWVETDRPCEVVVLGARARTFAVDGHHYALVCIGGLEPATTYEYEVALDGEVRWPLPGSPFPPSTVRTLGRDPVSIVFGSCRVTLPHEPPATLSKDEDERGHEFDALYTLAHELQDEPRADWPDLLLMLGDQVYVDEGSPRVREYIRSKRDTRRPPGEEIADFDEYTRLYQEAWSDPTIRWLFSTLSTAMVIDDHDMSDDWNISQAWVEEHMAHDWWHQREISGLVAYWIYQFIGNLAPEALAEHALYRRVLGVDDAWPLLRAFASREEAEHEGARWSYCRDLGSTRLLVIDSRCGRVLDEGRRSILDEEEWQWLEGHLHGDFDHVLIGTSDPVLLLPSLHYLETWNERVAAGAWGPTAAKVAERIRRRADFDHWAAFSHAFDRLTRLLAELGSGKRGRTPASIVLLSGDVHHAYLAEVGFRRRLGVRSPVYQAVCSPFRNPLDAGERRVLRVAGTRPARGLARALARAAGARDPEIRWRLVEGPFFDNQTATITLDHRTATLRLEKTVGDEQSDRRRLERVFQRRLTGQNGTKNAQRAG